MLGDAGRALPPVERRFLRRFRRLVADLGADLYVATRREAVAGCVHVTYSRQLLTGHRARIDLLAAAPQEPEAVVRALLETAIQRARRRDCVSLALEDAEAKIDPALLQRAGFHINYRVPMMALERREPSGE